jgi:hypothetical protein
VINEIFSEHDEDYGRVPDPSSLKVVEAFYVKPTRK